MVGTCTLREVTAELHKLYCGRRVGWWITYELEHQLVSRGPQQGLYRSLVSIVFFRLRTRTVTIVVYEMYVGLPSNVEITICRISMARLLSPSQLNLLSSTSTGKGE
jgi:hypothetical protein